MLMGTSSSILRRRRSWFVAHPSLPPSPSLPSPSSPPSILLPSLPFTFHPYPRSFPSSSRVSLVERAADLDLDFFLSSGQEDRLGGHAYPPRLLHVLLHRQDDPLLRRSLRYQSRSQAQGNGLLNAGIDFLPRLAVSFLVSSRLLLRPRPFVG